MKKWLDYTFRFLLITIPFTLGVIGFISAGNGTLQSIYCSLCLYGMGQKELPPNTLIEIARWIAPLATAGILIAIIKAAKRHFQNFVAKF